MKGQGYIDAFHVHVYTCSIYAIQLKLFNVKFESMWIHQQNFEIKLGNEIFNYHYNDSFRIIHSLKQFSFKDF